jgi:beta-galactosidase beta subunit
MESQGKEIMESRHPSSLTNIQDPMLYVEILKQRCTKVQWHQMIGIISDASSRLKTDELLEIHTIYLNVKTILKPQEDLIDGFLNFLPH